MERILQSLEKHDQIALLDLGSGRISLYSKAGHPESMSRPIDGIFSAVDSKLICFFRLGNKLIFKTENNSIEFKDDDKLLIEPVDENHKHFKILRDGEILFSYIYKRPYINPSISASQIFNPMIDDDDFDIYLFIYNVLRDHKRAEKIFRGSD